jgi:hypothetical protein
LPFGYDAAITSCFEVVSGKRNNAEIAVRMCGQKGIGKRVALIASSWGLEHGC